MVVENFIRIKCPNCGKILKVGISFSSDSASFDLTKKKGNLTCPNCKESQPWAVYKMVKKKQPVYDDADDDVVPPKYRTDETQMVSPLHDTIGQLVDERTGEAYQLKEGRQLVGRMTFKTPPKADLPIKTQDMGFSRSQFYLRVMKGRDGRYHTYISEASHSNPTSVNGQQLSPEDEDGLQHNDRITVSDTVLKFVGTVIDDATKIGHIKSSSDTTEL